MLKCEITLRHECSPVNLLHIFRIPFLKLDTHWGFRWILTEDFKFWIKSNIIPTCHYDVLIRRRGDVPLRLLGNVSPRRRWVFHLRRTCDIAGTYRETLSGRRHDVLLPGGVKYKFGTRAVK